MAVSALQLRMWLEPSHISQEASGAGSPMPALLVPGPGLSQDLLALLYDLLAYF